MSLKSSPGQFRQNGVNGILGGKGPFMPIPFPLPLKQLVEEKQKKAKSCPEDDEVAKEQIPPSQPAPVEEENEAEKKPKIVKSSHENEDVAKEEIPPAKVIQGVENLPDNEDLSHKEVVVKKRGSVTALARRIQKEVEAHLDLLESSRGEDIVAVLGNTGSGKSTTLNWLAEKKLVVNTRKRIVLEDESDPTAMNWQ